MGSSSPTLDFFGHTKRNPLADAYFSQAPLRYGDYIAKVGMFPVSPDLVAMVDQTLDTGADHNAFRTAVVSHMRDHGTEFENDSDASRPKGRLASANATNQLDSEPRHVPELGAPPLTLP